MSQERLILRFLKTHSHAVCQLNLDASLGPPCTWNHMLPLAPPANTCLPGSLSCYTEQTRSDPLLCVLSKAWVLVDNLLLL